MSTKGSEPGNPESAPVESRRTPAAAPVGSVTSDEVESPEGESSVLDVPDMGEFSAEAARPTPLDDIAEIERARIPKD